MYYFETPAIPQRQLMDGVMMKVAYGERMMMAFFDLDAGAVIPKHHHPHEQMGYILSGELTFDINGEKKICRPGDAYLIPGNIQHSAKVSETGPARVLDIFSPPREEYK